MRRNARPLSLLLAAALLAGCGGAARTRQTDTPEPAEAAVSGDTGAFSDGAETAAGTGTDTARAEARTLDLAYAEKFSVTYRADGAAELTIAGEDRFLVAPQDWAGEAEPGVPVLRKPLAGIYVAATSVMDLVLQLDALEAVGFTGTAASGWGLPEVREALEDGSVRYAGKYSAPDFELLVSEGCPLAVESTMIWHSPEIQEKLEALGIPVLVERSSYEPHPLGRMEWIKVYGLLLDREAEAEAFFDREAALLEELEVPASGEVKAAFFSINAAGAAVVRRPGDYVSKLIDLAGGAYVFESLSGDSSARSTLNMTMERFYTEARDADVLFYNSTIEGELETLADLLEKSPLLADFRGVERGEVWCVSYDMYQHSAAAAEIIREMNAIFCGNAEQTELRYFRRLE